MGEPTAKTANTTDGRSAAPQNSTGSHTSDGAESTARPGLVHSVMERVRTPRHPRLWFEIMLIGVSYYLYSQIRNAVPEQQTAALRHADAIWTLEHHLGLAVERGVNHGVNSVTWLIVGMNYYYATLHFIVTVGVLIWLYICHPGRYGPARLVVFMTTWLALIGFWAYPLAPPRLMTGGGFVDTVMLHHTWGSLSQGDLAQVSNQYAAMPSMHIGWSLWCGITIVTLAKPLWARILGALYPVATLLVIVSTGNHFWMDAVGGALCLAIGYAVAYVLYGRWVYALPKYATGSLSLEKHPEAAEG
ncbi:phosphatase PAP2 family protein [Streptomyces cocklensis]|nr:phosphatase PAP2 family protein [Actinacidiphila cocklensis]MDD1062275.1 phosphatase PAP2 family protein [Actinacidiphila cocklensis]WSX74163.1 phosphatase PAP2 family protein [Streptomyces sp. NBC_00899]WSX79773.1 phosphatase PAP2 family protein [Streptomyces sp. NBC_00899]